MAERVPMDLIREGKANKWVEHSTIALFLIGPAALPYKSQLGRIFFEGDMMVNREFFN